jgi:hypothetical protein
LSLLDEGADMILIGEARYRVVGLGRQAGLRDPAGSRGLEHRKPSAAQQGMDQGGDEHRLAGPRQAGDAEPDSRMEELVAVIGQRLQGQAGLFDEIRET